MVINGWNAFSDCNCRQQSRYRCLFISRLPSSLLGGCNLFGSLQCFMSLMNSLRAMVIQCDDGRRAEKNCQASVKSLEQLVGQRRFRASLTGQLFCFILNVSWASWIGLESKPCNSTGDALGLSIIPKPLSNSPSDSWSMPFDKFSRPLRNPSDFHRSDI